jgi:hypothetical protein
MLTETLVKKWFELWENGDFLNLPVSETFRHTSPFGTIEGKEQYFKLVAGNRDKFLGYNFKIHDALFGEQHACVRYTAIQGDFTLDVSEWYYINNDLIDKVIAYYHIGEIQTERKLNRPE